MSYINFPTPTPLFPILPSQAWSTHKKPILSSNKTQALTGRSTQMIRAVYPRWSFVLTFGGNAWLRTQTQNIIPDPTKVGLTEFEQISGLFLQCLGSYGEFYYLDPDDNSRAGLVCGALPFASGGGGRTYTFLIPITWGTGPFTPSFSVVSGGYNISSVDAVYLNGTVQDPSTYNFDPINCILVLTPPFGNVRTVTADVRFFYRCRFLDDKQDYSQFAHNLWENREVRFESVKP